MRKATLLMFVLALIYTLTACTHSKELRVYEVGDYDSFSNANHAKEYTLEVIKEHGIPHDKEIEYAGNEYETTYTYTEHGYLYQSSISFYTFENDMLYIKFGINDETARIDRFLMSSKNYLEQPLSRIMSEEECIAAARKYIGMFVDDLSEYVLTDSMYRDSIEYGGFYSLQFNKTIEGIQTSDSAYIEITIYGTIIAHRFYNLGEIKSEDIPSKVELSSIQNIVDAKLEAIYASVKEANSIEYLMSSRQMIKLKDGTYALEYLYTIQISPENDNKVATTEVTHLIVPLG